MLKSMVVKLFVYLCCYCVAGCVNWAYTVFLYLKNKWREFSPATMVRELWFHPECKAKIGGGSGMGGGSEHKHVKINGC